MTKSKSSFQILILVLVIFLLLLTVHTHPYGHGHEHDEKHCLLCQLLGTGFVDTLSFRLICFFIFLITVYRYKEIIIKAAKCFSYSFRAPPIRNIEYTII
jgi:hypothetical protein